MNPPATSPPSSPGAPWSGPSSGGVGLIALILALGPGMGGCGPEPDPAPLCLDGRVAVDDAGPIAPDAIAVAWTGPGALRVRGFSGAAPAGALVMVADQSATAGPDGRFDISATIASDAVEVDVGFEVAGQPLRSLPFRVRTPADAAACAVGAPAPTGTLPNDVALARCGDARLAVVAATFDAALDAVSLDGTPAPAGAYFPPEPDRGGAEPFGVSAHPSGDRAAVTLRGHHEVAWVDPCRAQVLARARPENAFGEIMRVVLDEPITLRDPRDVDGDGFADEVVERMQLMAPQAVLVGEDRLYVAYTNLLEPALDTDPPAPMLLGPAVAVVFSFENDELRTRAVRVYDGYLNPQALSFGPDGTVWLSLSGAFGIEDGRLVSASSGALLQLSAADLTLLRTIDVGDFAPATPAVVGDTVVVGSLLSAEALVLGPTAATLDDGERVVVHATERVQTVFEVVSLGAGLAGLLHFEGDRLRVLDVASRELDPWPFVSADGVGLRLAPASVAFRGPQAVALDEHLAGAVLLGLSAEVVPLALWQVLGP